MENWDQVAGDEPKELVLPQAETYTSAQEAMTSGQFETAMQQADPLRVYLQMAVRAKKLSPYDTFQLHVSIAKVRAEWRLKRFLPTRVRLVESLGLQAIAEAWVDLALSEMRARQEREFREKALTVL